MVLSIVAFVIIFSQGFIVDVAARTTYTVELERELLRGFVDDIGLFERHMPGVVAVTPLSDNVYLYRTAKEIPLAGTLATDFTIARRTVGDSLTIYESLTPDDPNYMRCAVLILRDTAATTRISLSLRLRLVRENGWSIHWMAPLLGEAFIESRMKAEITAMLKDFVTSSNMELYRRLLPQGARE
jgi:hypothetical protein